jgi:hypothetical protein
LKKKKEEKKRMVPNHFRTKINIMLSWPFPLIFFCFYPGEIKNIDRYYVKAMSLFL